MLARPGQRGRLSMPGAIATPRAWRQDSPIKLARLQIATEVLREEIERLGLEAKLRGRVAADEAEGAEAQAKTLENALLVLGGAAAPPPVADDACSWPGCGESGPYGFGVGLGQPGARRACAAHRVQVQELWQSEQAARAERAAEAIAPKTEMDGVGGRLI